MLRYLGVEIYRVLHKKSMYIFLGVIAVLTAAFSFIQGGMGEASAVGFSVMLLELLPVFVGAYWFVTIYCDDIKSNTISNTVGFGMGKAQLIISKLILMIVFAGVVFTIAPLYLKVLFSIFGTSFGTAAIKLVYISALKQLLQTVAFAAIAAIIAYGLQKSTFGMVSYILLATGLIDNLLTLLLTRKFVTDIIPGLDKYLVTSLVGDISEKLSAGETATMLFVEYFVIVIAASIIGIFAFKNKELEF